MVNNFPPRVLIKLKRLRIVSERINRRRELNISDLPSSLKSPRFTRPSLHLCDDQKIASARERARKIHIAPFAQSREGPAPFRHNRDNPCRRCFVRADNFFYGFLKSARVRAPFRETFKTLPRAPGRCPG